MVNVPFVQAHLHLSRADQKEKNAALHGRGHAYRSPRCVHDSNAGLRPDLFLKKLNELFFGAYAKLAIHISHMSSDGILRNIKTSGDIR